MKDIKELTYILLLIGGLGLLLLLLGKPISEGFASGSNRCDVDNPCPGSLKCVNGFCADTNRVPMVQEEEPVPLLPPGAPAPYF
jgi:hypothetical protein